MVRSAVLTSFLVLTFVGCKSAPKSPTLPPSLADRVAETHGKESWGNQKVLSGRLVCAMKDGPTIDFRFLHHVPTGRTRMDWADRTVVIWDGQTAWVSPSSSTLQGVRYHLLTWPYLLTLPFHLHDVGVQATELEEKPLSGRTYLSTTVSFPNAPTFPEDQHVLYADPKTGRLEAVAYTRTPGQARGGDEESRAVTFYDFKRAEGVQLPQEWRFWKWNATVGLYGEPLGQARLVELEFIPLKERQFARPADAREEK